MSIDLKSLSEKQLRKLIADAAKEQKRKKKRAPIAAVRRKLTRMAIAEGYTLIELFGASGASKRASTSAGTARGPRPSGTRGSTVAPKYRNPANPAETWSGRGKHPRWLAALVAAGRRPEEFLIAP